MATETHRSRLTSTVMKAMGLFSGLQITGILCSMIKTKLVAIWLGATGVGLFGIYQSVTETLATLTDLGLRQSAVRDVATRRTDSSRLRMVITVVRRWSLLAGLLGAVIIMAVSPLLAEWFFDSESRVWGFVALSAAMLLNSLSGGEQALLQGSGKLKALAQGNLWGTLAGLAVSIPMFRYLGENSVVMSIIAYALTLYMSLRIFARKDKVQGAAIGLRQIWTEGKGFARLGISMALAAFVTGLAHTLFIALISSRFGTVQVGLVQAGDTVIVRYIGLIFTAIGMEFYPRLAAAAGSRRIVQTYVNHEATLLLLLLIPLLLLFIMLREVVVSVLYAPEFMQIIPFITWGALSSIPKALSWCMAFTIISRGDGKIYILTESLDALLSVPVCYFAFLQWGFTGLGVAYICWYLLYLLLTGIVYYRRYKLRLSKAVIWLGLAAMLICAVAVPAKQMLPPAASATLCLLAALCFIRPLVRMMKNK